jgi:outer membrane protein assembly factor BamB
MTKVVQLQVEAWRRDLHQRPNHRTIVRSDLVIVPERRTRLLRLDPATGGPVWSAHVENTWGWLAAASDSVFYLNQHNRLQCLALDTGEERWTADLRGINGWLVPAGPVLLVGGWRGYGPLLALDVKTGVARWQEDRRGGNAEPIVGPWGIAVASLEEPVIRFLAPETGAPHGEVPLPAHGQEPDASPLLRRHGDRLLLAGRDGRMHQLATPRGPWTVLFEHADGIRTQAPPVVGSDVVFMDGAGHLNCYDVVAGERRWSAPWQHGRVDVLPAAASPRGMLAVGSANGRLAVFGRDGAQLWSKTVARRIETDVAWLDDGALLAGTTSSLIAVRPALGEPL